MSMEVVLLAAQAISHFTHCFIHYRVKGLMTKTGPTDIRVCLVSESTVLVW